MPDRVLIVANALVHDADASLPGELRRGGPARELMVIAPLHTSRAQSLCSDVDGARRDAEERLQAIATDMSRFRQAPRTSVVEEDPVQAVADALVEFKADACLVVDRVAGRGAHREAGAATRIHSRFELPTTALTVDGEGRIVDHQML